MKLEKYPHAILALSKEFDGKKTLAKLARDSEKVTPGEHEVDLHLHIKGTLKVGEDYTAAPTASIPLLPTVALLVQRMGFQREQALDLIAEAMQGALENGTKGAEGLEAMVKDLEGVQKEVRERVLSKLPRRQCKGQVRFSGIVEPEGFPVTPVE